MRRVIISNGCNSIASVSLAERLSAVPASSKALQVCAAVIASMVNVPFVRPPRVSQMRTMMSSLPSSAGFTALISAPGTSSEITEAGTRGAPSTMRTG